MKTIALPFVLLALVAVPQKDAGKKPRGKITIGKETTYVTGPLDRDGYVNYVAALNERLKQGVTPENNANVLIWKALGPTPEGGKPPAAEFFSLMGTTSPPEKGDYFIDQSRFARERLQIASENLEKEMWTPVSHCMQRPWKAEEYPNVAAWLKANDKPLAIMVEASRRTQYYSPLVPFQSPNGPHGLMSALLPAVQKCRETSSALTARAMLRTGEGAEADAWQDLLACHRLGRLVGRGPTLIESLVGIAIDAIAGRADLGFLARPQLSAQRLEACLRDLQKLPPTAPVADKVDLAERFTFLESITLVDRYGIKYLESLSDGHASDVGGLTDTVLQDVNWDPALTNANRWYDRVAGAMREKDRTTRRKKLEEIDADLKKLKVDLTEGGGIGQLLVGDKAERGKVLGDIMIALLLPAISKVQGASDRIQQTQDNLQVAFALEWYRREQGTYPKQLAALAPRYLAAVPPDLFSGKPLVYKPSDTGYLLYSVGPNGKDDEGRGPEDEPRGDDLSIRIPPPAK